MTTCPRLCRCRIWSVGAAAIAIAIAAAVTNDGKRRSNIIIRDMLLSIALLGKGSKQHKK